MATRFDRGLSVVAYGLLHFFLELRFVTTRLRDILVVEWGQFLFSFESFHHVTK